MGNCLLWTHAKVLYKHMLGLRWIKLYLHGNSSIGYSLQFIQLNYIKMEHILCPDRLNIGSNATDAEKNTDIGKSHWTILLMNTKTTFQINYVVLLNMSLRQYMNLYRAVWHLNLLLTFWIEFFIKRKKKHFCSIFLPCQRLKVLMNSSGNYTNWAKFTNLWMLVLNWVSSGISLRCIY